MSAVASVRWWMYHSVVGWVRASQFIGTALLYPAIIIHELTHAVFAYPWVDEYVDIQLYGPEAGVSVRWRAGTPRWVIGLAHIAPTLLGVVAAPAILLVAGMPSGVGDWVAAGILGANWMVYTRPSADDIQLPEMEVSE